MPSVATTRVRVESISLRGPGVVVLTGPSSCGKGEVAAALCELVSIPKDHHLSMGEILRSTIQRAQNDAVYAELLSRKYRIDGKTNIYECFDTSEDLTKKVQSYLPELEQYCKRSDVDRFVSQLEWLEYCTYHGLLVPNRWTQEFIAAAIESSPLRHKIPFILDGYPRRRNAAEHLLQFLDSQLIPVIKVLHLSISRQEMISRARGRGRVDDDEESLLARYQFYTDSVQPTVDYMKQQLGSDAIALIDAHQPVYNVVNDVGTLNLDESIVNVVASSLRGLGVASVVVADLMEKRCEQRLSAKHVPV